MELFVSNINWKAKEKDIEEAFSQFGRVESCKIVTDKITKRSRGFAFVKMDSAQEANDAINGLNDVLFMSRQLVVRISEEKVRKN